jgi:DNA-binding response OmpR family regulator
MTKVVIINEDPNFCRQYQRALEKEGFEVEVYYDGKVGLTHVLVAHPEVIILGLMLPTMNGFDVLEVLKKKETTCKIPVIICSNLTGDEIQDLKDFKVSAFFPRTNCTPKMIIEKVRSLLV